MRWLNPSDPRVRAAVVSGGWGKTPHSDLHAPLPVDREEIDVLAVALEVASDILTSLTAGAFHPPLQVVEDFVCYPQTVALSPTLGPVQPDVQLWTMSDTGDPVVSMEDVQVFAGSVRFVHRPTYAMSPSYARSMTSYGDQFVDLAWAWQRAMACACPVNPRLRLIYEAGSTISAAARAAVLSLAHELWLQVNPCDDCGSCRLPMRTTSVQREGISFSIADPVDPANPRTGTGLPEVDLWVQQVNPFRVSRIPRVFDPSRPPAVTHSIISATPTFPTVPTGQLGATAAVVAQGVVA